ncbi:MAG: ParB/RepB/Spo0J family partition protein [Actinobacteria bacterium]|nr:ParB/RepB/Spo0J family partition protein [Actinomycetota bacterium]
MSVKRRALGRGLGALIPTSSEGNGSSRPMDVFFKGNSAAPIDVEPPVSRETADGYLDQTPGSTIAAATALLDLAPVPGARYAELPVLSIRPNPKQPRQAFGDDDMAELTHSIREIGVLQPVVVRPIPDEELRRTAGQSPDEVDGPRFELIMGERRWRATQAAGLAVIPAIIKDTHDDDLLRDALLENLHRSELNALEEAAAYQQLLDDFGCTHDQLAARIGRSRPQISNTLRLLKLPPLVQRRVAAGVLSAGHARALLGLADRDAMERLAQRIVAEGLSVRNVEEVVTLGGDDTPRARKPRAGAHHPQLDDLAARLSDRFDTRVRIDLGQRKGKLMFEFASVEDLDRIVDTMGGHAAGGDMAGVTSA